MPYVRSALVILAMIFALPSAVLAQYITREQQQEQARQNLERHRNQPQPGVQGSTNTVQGSTNTYGGAWVEQQLQGDKPRTRTW
jgi:hypothetical protein